MYVSFHLLSLSFFLFQAHTLTNRDVAQGTLQTLIAAVFGIQTGFQGTVISTFARLNLDHVVDEVNDEMLGPWAVLKEKAGIANKPNPLTPFLEKELLKDTDLSIDGSRFQSVTGFECKIKELDKERVEEMIESYKRMGWWP
jgi:hypothetical protein